jgi:hypothetical protein
MTRHAVHKIGEPYSLAAARHQAEVDINAELESHHEAEVKRVRGLTVSAWIDELGTGDRSLIEEMISVNASGWKA